MVGHEVDEGKKVDGPIRGSVGLLALGAVGKVPFVCKQVDTFGREQTPLPSESGD